jgi:hypothetical protein
LFLGFFFRDFWAFFVLELKTFNQFSTNMASQGRNKYPLICKWDKRVVLGEIDLLLESIKGGSLCSEQELP